MLYNHLYRDLSMIQLNATSLPLTILIYSQASYISNTKKIYIAPIEIPITSLNMTNPISSPFLPYLYHVLPQSNKLAYINTFLSQFSLTSTHHNQWLYHSSRSPNRYNLILILPPQLIFMPLKLSPCLISLFPLSIPLPDALLSLVLSTMKIMISMHLYQLLHCTIFLHQILGCKRTITPPL